MSLLFNLLDTVDKKKILIQQIGLNNEIRNIDKKRVVIHSQKINLKQKLIDNLVVFVQHLWSEHFELTIQEDVSHDG